MYRLIVTDYDGTLVMPEGKITDALVAKLHRLCGCGTLVCIASGRPYNQLKRLFAPLLQDVCFICDDGALLMYRNCVLYKKPLEMNAVKEIASAANGAGLTVYAACREENVLLDSGRLSRLFPVSGDIFKLVIEKNGKDVSALKQLIAQKNLRVCFDDGRFLECCHRDADKGTALETLMRKFSVPSTGTLGFGDNDNDVSFLKLCGTRLCPPSAKDAVHTLAQQITDVQEYLLEL